MIGISATHCQMANGIMIINKNTKKNARRGSLKQHASCEFDRLSGYFSSWYLQEGVLTIFRAT